MYFTVQIIRSDCTLLILYKYSPFVCTLIVLSRYYPYYLNCASTPPTTCIVQVLSLLPVLYRYSTYYLYCLHVLQLLPVLYGFSHLLPVLYGYSIYYLYCTGTLPTTCTVRVLPLLPVRYGYSPYYLYCTGTPLTTCTVRVLHQVDHLVLQLALLLLQIHPKLILQNFKLKENLSKYSNISQYKINVKKVTSQANVCF